MEIPYDPAIYFWEFIQKKQITILKRYMHPCVHCSIITTANIWKQPKCPSMDEWMKRKWYIYTMEYNSAIQKKRNAAICDNTDRLTGYHTR